MASTAAGLEMIQAIRAKDEEFIRNLNSGNVDALVSGFYAEDADLLPPHAPIIKGRAAIQEFWKGMVSAGLKVLVLETKRVEESGDLAYGSGVFELTLSPPGGDTMSDKGKYVVVYRRQHDGTWQAVADIFNSSEPAQRSSA
jgi:ketosteroid isomerase-like protein